MQNNLHTYELFIDDLKDFGQVSFISLVEEPAIEEDYILLNKKNFNVSLAKVDDIKGIITGPALIPNKNIYRYDPKTNEEYYIFFSADTVKKLSQKFLRDGLLHNIKVDHSTEVENVFVVESWITGESDKAKSDFGYDVPVGTWMVSMKVENPDVLNRIKKGELNGFSIEAAMLDVVEKLNKSNSCDCGCETKCIETQALNDIVDLLNFNKEPVIEIKDLISDYVDNWIYGENPDELRLKDIYELIEKGDILHIEDGNIEASIRLERDIKDIYEIILKNYPPNVNRIYDPKVPENERGTIEVDPKRPDRTKVPDVSKKEKIKRILQFGLYQWVLGSGGNSGKHCPHCVYYAGQIRTINDWLKVAVPGNGQTFCKQHCTCRLIKIKKV